MLSSKPLKPVTPAEREAYEVDGVVCRRDIFPRQWLSYLAEAVEEAMTVRERFPLVWSE